MIGPGKAFDTDHYFVVSHQPARRLPRHDRARRRSTRPPARRTARTSRSSPSPTWCAPSAPSSTSSGIDRLAAVAGGSLGGMQALEWAVALPRPGRRHRGRSPAPTRCTRRAWPGTRSPARRSGATRPGRAATTTAPAASPTPAWASPGWSATSPTCPAPALEDKFGRRLQYADDIRYTITEPEFEVESYLRHQADSFVKRFDANTYLYTSRALTYFDLAREHGDGSLERGARGRRGAHAADRVQLRLALPARRRRRRSRRRCARSASRSSCT